MYPNVLVYHSLTSSVPAADDEGNSARDRTYRKLPVQEVASESASKITAMALHISAPPPLQGEYQSLHVARCLVMRETITICRTRRLIFLIFFECCRMRRAQSDFYVFSG